MSTRLLFQEVVAEQPERFFVAEILREKILLQYHQEIPYATAVRLLPTLGSNTCMYPCKLYS